MVALITPFRDGQVDEVALRALVEWHIAEGTDAIVATGTTGESATLSHAEHHDVIRIVVEQTKGRIPVIAGTGSNATRESLELTAFAKEAGADAALLITPYYNKPTQEGLYQHYKTIAEAVHLPIMLYNVPGRTAVNMSAETVARLAEIPNVVSIKEATADMELASNILRLAGNKIELISGDDATVLPFMAIGGKGVISVTANIAPRMVSDMVHACLEGRWDDARVLHMKLLHINKLMFVESNPIPVKAAVAMLGRCGEELRLPLTPLSEQYRQPLWEEMQGLGLVSGN